jgi:hypothetical protein
VFVELISSELRRRIGWLSQYPGPDFRIAESLNALCEGQFHQWPISRPVAEGVHPRLVAHQHPEGSAGHLRPDCRTARVGLVYHREPLPPIVWILFVDHRQEGERYPVLLPEPCDPLDLGVD